MDGLVLRLLLAREYKESRQGYPFTGLSKDAFRPKRPGWP